MVKYVESARNFYALLISLKLFLGIHWKRLTEADRTIGNVVSPSFHFTWREQVKPGKYSQINCSLIEIRIMYLSSAS
jgi:hypothetical protein